MRQVSMFDPATPSNALMDFTLREAENMWDGAEHRKRGIAQVASFARFRDSLSLHYRVNFGSPFFFNPCRKRCSSLRRN